MSKQKQSGASTLKGSKQAKRAMVAILEALAGTCGTTEAAERLSISLSRYYQLETRALQGMMAALEPRPRGRKKTPNDEIRALKAEIRVFERELRQARSLLRAASRSVGIKPLAKRAASKKKGARRRRGSRGATVLRTLKEDVREEAADGAQERDREPAATDGGK